MEGNRANTVSCEDRRNVLAMYDVRGIQSYIFKTNRVKDIIGASGLVEHIIEDAFREAARQVMQPEEYLTDWENWQEEQLDFFGNEKIKAQVLFIGGGNAYVVFRGRKLCEAVNRKMSGYILEHTYSLQLAVAVIDMGTDYYSDYQKLNQEMTRIKQEMPLTRCLGALPVTAVDPMTGYPLTKAEFGDQGERLCTEVRLKRNALKRMKKEGKEKKFDTLITQKGEESQIAVIHLDGNNLGMRIRMLMEDPALQNASYEASVFRMRKISRNIKRKFLETFEEMEAYLKEWVRSSKNTVLSQEEDAVYLRRIIVAGDDVTFVCNARVALALVEFFVNKISQKTMFGEENTENLQEYGFSVCAGIAFINSHFPFSIGYEVAEACCANAKKRAKNPAYMIGNRVGNWVDFQICKNVQTGNLKESRSRNYCLADGSMLLRRPFYLRGCAQDEEMDQACAKYDFAEFKKQSAFFSDDTKLPRGFVKNMRNTYPYGKAEMERLIVFALSRDRSMPDGSEEAFEEGLAKWYDALEMLDYYIDMEEGGDPDEDQN